MVLVFDLCGYRKESEGLTKSALYFKVAFRSHLSTTINNIKVDIYEKLATKGQGIIVIGRSLVLT